MESDGDESKRGEPHLHCKCGLSEKALGFTGLKCRATVAGALCMDRVRRRRSADDDLQRELARDWISTRKGYTDFTSN